MRSFVILAVLSFASGLLSLAQSISAGESSARIGRPKNQRQRCPKFMAHVCKQVTFQLVQLTNLLQEFLQLFVLPRNFRFRGFLFGDVSAFGQQEDDLSTLISNRHEREIDDYCFLARRSPVNLDVTTNEFASRCSRDQLPLLFPCFSRHLPPTSFPERFVLNIAQLDTGTFEGCSIDFQSHAVAVKKPDKLLHLVQNDSSQLFAICLGLISARQHNLTDRKGGDICKQMLADCRHESSYRLSGT
jgi:hypothetical protein